jgi:hypothetical protein
MDGAGEIDNNQAAHGWAGRINNHKNNEKQRSKNN